VSERTQKIISLVIIILAAVGLFDATFLSISHFTGQEVICEIGDYNSCGTVTTSEYSTILGVPVALFGAIYYLLIFFLAMFSLGGNRKALKKVVLLSGLGVLASAWFVYLQLFVLNSICLYCMVSASTTTLIFILSIFTLASRKRFS